MPIRLTDEIITAAIEGYVAQKRHLDEQIAELRGALSGNNSASGASAPARKRRRMSAAARQRIAEAQRQRWAATREKSAQPARPAKTKSAMSRSKSSPTWPPPSSPRPRSAGPKSAPRPKKPRPKKPRPKKQLPKKPLRRKRHPLHKPLTRRSLWGSFQPAGRRPRRSTGRGQALTSAGQA